MSSYWRENVDDRYRATALSDWCVELQDWPAESIGNALSQYRRDNPSKKPNPGHILAILKDAWGRHMAKETRKVLAASDRQHRSPGKASVPLERRREILAEHGLLKVKETAHGEDQARAERRKARLERAAEVLNAITRKL